MRKSPIPSGRVAIIIWLAFLTLSAFVISRTQFTTDLSAFLPKSPTPQQELLLEQIRDGLASRLILVSIGGADASSRAELSRQMAARLRADAEFVSVNNGEPVNTEADRAYLFNNRYLLSPQVTPDLFTVAGLHSALNDSIELLASPAGLLVKSLLPRDPTGEMIHLLEQLDSDAQPPVFDGVWATSDGTQAMMLVQTRSSGTDTDGQQHAMNSIREAFNSVPAAKPTMRLVMTGPGVFSVTARETIKSQVKRLSIISVILITTLLLLLYRSFAALGLGLLPVLSGAVAGIAVVSLGFGEVHGITLGFGTALIGEAVDYSIYLFVQSDNTGGDRRNWTIEFWPTIRLGVVTSIFGFAALLFSGFPGLAQLGLYSISGLISAALVTRFVLPYLLPDNFQVHDVSRIGRILSDLTTHAARLRWPAIVVLVLAGGIVAQHRGDLWNDKISSLSPISEAEVELDTGLRAELGAPDVRFLVVASGADQEDVLISAEQVSAVLQVLVDQGQLAGFESPSRYLPSNATQLARQASLPAVTVLEDHLAQAVQDLPVRADLFAPFIADIEAARSQPLLSTADLENTSMAMAVDALLIKQSDHWSAVLPLTAPPDAGIDADHIRAALDSAGLSGVLFVDLKAESDNLYSGYLREVIQMSLGGLAAIVALLLLVYRSPWRVLRNILPLVAAVLSVVAGLILFGQQLIILHLVGLLLVVAVGSNYALLLDRTYQAGLSLHDRPGTESPSATPPTERRTSPRILASMLFASLTTVLGFGVLAFSSVSILQAMGVTVAPGVVLALLYSAIFVKTTDA
ncbi:MMPL family transporter [Pseudomonadota bacterium]